MNRELFSSILESLDKTINLQENFNTDLSVSELKVLLPRILEERADDLKSGLIISLRAALQQQKDFVEIMPIGLMIHRKGEIIYTNPEFRRLTGYESPEELIGQPVANLVAAEYRAEIQNRILNITEKGAFHNAPIEMVGVKKNGERSYFEAESVSVVHGGEQAVVVILRDVSARKTALENLRQSDENFQNIIRQMPDGVMIKDEKRVLFANDSLARMLGYDSPEELKGMESLQLVHPDYRAVSQERLEKLYAGASPNPLCKFKMLAKDGKTVDVESSSIFIQYYGRDAVMAVLRDMTLQNHMERQAVNNDKLATLGTLAAGVAHEVNNPLTYVLGNLTFLHEQVEEMKTRMQGKGCVDENCKRILAEMAEEITDITQGSERIRDIVKGLKSFARGGEDSVEKVNLNQVIESAINMTFHMMKKKARLEKDMAVDLPALNVNAGKIQQVMINLLVNAAQAISGNHPSENKITVRTGRQDGNLFVEVSDTGKGIPEEVLPRIFDPFFTTKPVGEGTGLGLAVCNEIMRHYQGTIEVRSRVGKGTTFTVTLPLENGLCGAKIATAAPPVEKKLGRVLVVDDEPGNLDVIAKTLKKDYEVLSALSGVEAMAILEKGEAVDAIVSDINMPEMDGMTLFRTVSKVFPGMESKMVFITGGIFAEDVNEFLKSVPNYCLEKPFNQTDLRLAVSHCMELKKGESLG